VKLRKGDKVTLIKPLTVRGSFSVGTYPEGATLEIQQVSEGARKYLVGNEWIHYTRIENAMREVSE